MKTTRRTWAMGMMLLWLWGCDAPEETKTADTASASKSAAPPAATSATAAPKPSAPEKKPTHPCPEGTEGDGTLSKPCMASGKTRIMDAKWTGKITDKGPSFTVKNNAKLEIMYGHIFVYFYDAAGKQLEVGEGDDKKPYQACGGNIFAGPMKAGEKATLWFSCVKKKHVPEGTKHIEGELKTVGFSAEPGKKADTFWRNADLAPEERPKGGIK